MISKRQLIPAMGLMTIAFGTYMSVRLAAQTPSQEPFDFSNAVYAEVRENTSPNEIERKATLAPTGDVATASGEAEIEVSGSGNRRRQEVEFEVRNLQPGAIYTFVIDGRHFATVTANNRGRAEHERHVPLPGGMSR
jgi:hypothetical protein